MVFGIGETLLKTLLVVISDSLPSLVTKGELVSRYYNPGGVFDDVVLVSTGPGLVETERLQPTVGSARLRLYSMPSPSFLRTLGWRDAGLRPWLAEARAFSDRIAPHAVRAYGNFENGYWAAHVAQHRRVPFVVSLHGDSDEDMRARCPAWALKRRWRLSRQRELEAFAIASADLVIGVYESVRSYAMRLGAKRFEVCYNMIMPGIVAKTSYAITSRPRIISVTRQVEDKNPEHLMRAAQQLGIHMTLVGNGPIHARLRNLAAQLDSSAFEFFPSLPNAEVCARLHAFDAFAMHSQCYELNKPVIEAAFASLPIVLNRRLGRPVPELQNGWLLLDENSEAGYTRSLKRLFGDEALRRRLGVEARRFVEFRCAPQATESRFAGFYQELLSA